MVVIGEQEVYAA